MITIVNLVWGKWPGGKWQMTGCLPRRYFMNFREALKRNTTREFKHVLYAAKPEAFNTRYFRTQENLVIKPLGPISGWRGCMPKLEAFKSDPDLQGQVWVFDLDNVITGNIDGLLSYKGDFAICWDPCPKRKGLIGGNISSYPAGTLESIYLKVAENYPEYETICQGSERFLLDHMLAAGDLKSCEFLQDICPGQIQSLKFDLNYSHVPPPEMSILWLHGRPRPHQLKKKGYPEFQKLWEGKAMR